MITEIGIVAGEIWNFLDKHGQVDLEQLITGIEKSRELTFMSLGWLSREGHVLFKKNGLDYKISLRKKEKK